MKVAFIPFGVLLRADENLIKTRETRFSSHRN